MNKSTTFSEIKGFLAKSFFIPSKAIKPSLPIQKIGLSDMEYWELIANIENNNNLTLPDSELNRVATISDLVVLVHKTSQSLYRVAA